MCRDAERIEATTDIDLADPNSFSQVLGSAKPIEAKTYPWVRCTLSKTLVWSHPAAPVSLSNQSVTVNGPAGPTPSQMTVYWATHAEGGRPMGSTGGDGTKTKPFLLGAAAEIRADASTTLRLVFAVRIADETGVISPKIAGHVNLRDPPLAGLAEPRLQAQRQEGDVVRIVGSARR